MTSFALHSAIQNDVTRSYQSNDAHFSADNLMLPLFVTDSDEQHDIGSLVDMHHVPAARIAEYVAPLMQLGLRAVLVFGVLMHGEKAKCESGRVAYSAASPVVVAIKALKAAYPQLMVAADVCLCGYTSHGHCGVFNDAGHLDAERSADAIGRLALHYAQAGADMVAPSDMMDNRVASIKKHLFANALGNRVAVMSYSAKFASALYGPFRAAALSAPAHGDRRCYQLPPGARKLALRAVRRDLAEGADFVMVKPAGMYLDIIRESAELADVPIACYQVSGEYAMIHAAAAAGCLDLDATMLESIAALRRAGATIIITYFTPRLLKHLAKPQITVDNNK